MNMNIDYLLILFPRQIALLIKATQLLKNGKNFEALINTDLRIRSNKRVTPAFIYAALVWSSVQKIASEYERQGHPAYSALNKAANEVISNQIPITSDFEALHYGYA